ncbi:hypothetical protein [Nocardia brasiliensis]|uniref:Transposase IS111A/IS1328/IS1533 n=1 Tax=Nocardia brasiliensis (strain ATCC 700358 / HUJEG-1) TaxID=1133849 RepID=K0F0W9_NOCB7|nr:transposase IS111A/IS1328/IS1533 [Nocardia brasiliensis ATCC 700358]OCF85559.1 hypothetical protein AW168_35455 [Nocardia brasiliensis]
MNAAESAVTAARAQTVCLPGMGFRLDADFLTDIGDPGLIASVDHSAVPAPVLRNLRTHRTIARSQPLRQIPRRVFYMSA